VKPKRKKIGWQGKLETETNLTGEDKNTLRWRRGVGVSARLKGRHGKVLVEIGEKEGTQITRGPLIED